MIHPTHEFVSMNFNGVPVSACRHCGLQTMAAEASEPCKAKPGEGQLVALGSAGTTPLTATALPGVSQTTSLRDLIASLSSESLRKRLAELEGEVAALKVLLKAAEAKEGGK